MSASYVSGTNGPKVSVASAVAAASANDTIYIRAGSYTNATAIALGKKLFFVGYSGEEDLISIEPPSNNDLFQLNAGSDGTEFHNLTFTGGAEVDKGIIVSGGARSYILLDNINFIDTSHKPVKMSGNPTLYVQNTKTLRSKQRWELNATTQIDNSVWVNSGSASTPQPALRILGGTTIVNNSVFLGGYNNSSGAVLALNGTNTFNNCIVAGLPNSGLQPPISIISGTTVLNNCFLGGNLFTPHSTVSGSGLTINNSYTNKNPNFTLLPSNDAIFTFFAQDSNQGDSPSVPILDYSEALDDLGLHMSWFPDDSGHFTDEQKTAMATFNAAGHDLGVQGQSSSRLDKDNPFYVSYTGSGANPKIIIAVTDENAATLTGRTDSGDDFILDISKTGTNKFIGAGVETNSVTKVINDHADWSAEINWTGNYDDSFSYTLASSTYNIAGNTDILLDKTGRFFTEEIANSKSLVEAVIGGSFSAKSYFFARQIPDSDASTFVKNSGFDIALSGISLSTDVTYLNSISNIYDVRNVYSNLSPVNIRGLGYSSLSDSEKEERIRDFARNWSVVARTNGIWASLELKNPDIVTSDEYLTTMELTWLADELTNNGVRVLDFKEAHDYIDSVSIASGDGYVRSLSTAYDLSLTSTSSAINAGISISGRTTDILGNSLYGDPDIGAYEYQWVSPTAAFTSSISNRSVDFTDTSSDSDGSISSWSWNFGDTQTSTSQNPSHEYSDNGDYTVTLVVTDNHGAAATTTSSISVSRSSGSSGTRISLSDTSSEEETTDREALLARITELQALLKQLQAQKQNTNAVCTFTRNLQLHSVGNDVQCLQQYLNQNGFVVTQTGDGAPGFETTYFGNLTLNALVRFQNAHAAEILIPVGLTQGSGYFGPSTRAFINGN